MFDATAAQYEPDPETRLSHAIPGIAVVWRGAASSFDAFMVITVRMPARPRECLLFQVMAVPPSGRREHLP